MSTDPRVKKLTSGRAIAIAVAAGIAIGALFSIAAGGDDGDAYLVRAVFDNGSFVIPGEDVKIAGVVVGTIHDVDLTEQNQAAVVLKIDDPAFVPFRKDAQCQIRLQSLIGEQFIECVPTRPNKEGTPPAAELAQIEDGRGEGQHLLPADNNVTPVGEDLLRNINRLPQREGLRLIVNEFGAGLAGNGDRLREAVRRANPALKEFDGWIKVLADQDRLLGRLIDESDTVLAAWVDKRKETAGFIDKAGATAAAAAERGDDIERNFERFPAFLRELKPTTERFSGLADQMTPALDSLDSQAKAINATVQGTGPFFQAATPALVSLGDFGDRARELFPAIRPLIGQLDDLGRPLRPATKDLAKLFGSFDDTGGIEELMKLIYFYTGTVNGVDTKGHYVRSSLVFNGLCVTRTGNSPRRDPENCGSTLQQYGDPVKAGAAAASEPKTPEELEQAIAPNKAIAGVPLDSEDAKPLLDYLFGGGR
ncbi:MAG TPA: MlaD family protein [Thermoleophilaceae bacterium]|nr:MlaD family protein [Thermoleophilaceae bacterium]